MTTESKEEITKLKRKAVRELKNPTWVTAPIEVETKRKLLIYAAIKGLTVERAIRQAIEDAIEKTNLPPIE